MATAPRQTTYTSGVIVATNAAYGGAYKVTIPFEASKVTISVVASSGSPRLLLSFDGVTDCAVLDHDKGSPASSYTFEKQRITTLFYKQTGTDCHFIVNAEMQAWPTIVG